MDKSEAECENCVIKGDKLEEAILTKLNAFSKQALVHKGYEVPIIREPPAL